MSSTPVSCYKIGTEIKLTAVFRKFPEGYAAFVEELPGANTQGETLASFNNASTAGEVIQFFAGLRAGATA